MTKRSWGKNLSRQNETPKQGGQKAPRTRKSSGAVANFRVSGYFSHRWPVLGPEVARSQAPWGAALSLFLQTCNVDITSMPATLGQSAQLRLAAALLPSCRPKQSGVCRGQQEPRAAEVDREPADVDSTSYLLFHQRGLSAWVCPRRTDSSPS